MQVPLQADDSFLKKVVTLWPPGASEYFRTHSEIHCTEWKTSLTRVSQNTELLELLWGLD